MPIAEFCHEITCALREGQGVVSIAMPYECDDPPPAGTLVEWCPEPDAFLLGCVTLAVLWGVRRWHNKIRKNTGTD